MKNLSFLLLVVGCWLLANDAATAQAYDLKAPTFRNILLDEPQGKHFNFMQHTKLDAVGRDPLHLGWYRISKQKLWGWGIVSLAGFVDGVVEGYEFQGRTSFERKWGVGQYSYFGSRSYEMVRSQSVKRDFYHQGDDARKLGYIGGAVCIGIGGAKVNNKWWHYLVDFGVSAAASGFLKSRGLNWVRYDNLIF